LHHEQQVCFELNVIQHFLLTAQICNILQHFQSLFVFTFKTDSKI